MNIGGHVCLKELFFQPTKWCRNTCWKCYVKQHFSTNRFTPVEEQIRFLKIFLRGEEHSAAQISISVDNLPLEDDLLSVFRRQHMVRLLKEVLDSPEMDNRSCVVGLTLNSPNTYAEYVKHGVSSDLFEKVDFISFSSLAFFDERFIRSFRHPKICLNWQLSDLAVAQDLPTLLPLLESVYVIFPKYQNYLGFNLDQLLASLPEDQKKKLVQDQCYSDTLGYLYFTKTCSAGLSKMQVWPDGSVSGCPYAKFSDTTEGLTAEAMIQNVLDARLKLDMDKCPVLQSMVLGTEGCGDND